MDDRTCNKRQCHIYKMPQGELKINPVLLLRLSLRYEKSVSQDIGLNH